MVRKLFFFVCAVMYIVSAMTANAAPLANGTALKITPGIGSDINTPCTIGSCIGWDMSANGTLISWRNITPGTDGGFIVGKSQVSGGQEINGSLTTSGELTAAGWLFLFSSSGADATLYTAPNATANLFDDASCTKAACIGRTELNILNVAWGGQSTPIGSAAGCNVSLLPKCTADQQAGIFVNNYGIDLVGNTWFMDYAQVVPSGGFAGSPFRIIFRGSVVPVPQPNCPVVGYAWGNPTAPGILVFGSNLRGATSVLINGVNAPVFQAITDDMLWVLPPNAVTWPWKPGTVQVNNANAGCSGSFPKPCTP
jgi:hypothetical protein